MLYLLLPPPLSEYAASLKKADKRASEAEKRAAEREDQAQRRETVAMEMEASAMKHLDLAAAERHAYRRPQQKVRVDRHARRTERSMGQRGRLHCTKFWVSPVWREERGLANDNAGAQPSED